MYSLNHASTIVNSLLREILNHAGSCGIIAMRNSKPCWHQNKVVPSQ